MLGQLYFWEKKIDQLNKPWTVSELLDLGLPGFEGLELSDMPSEAQEQARVITTAFINGYQTFLSDSDARKAAVAWKYLTSPYTVQEGGASEGEFWSNVYSWIVDRKKETLDTILADGLLSANESIYGFAFGLKVIHYFTEYSELDQAEQSDRLLYQSLRDQSEILYYGSVSIDILFTNLNAQKVVLTDDYAFDATLIRSTLDAYPSISLVLVDAQDADDRVQFLQKKLPSGVLISSVQLQNQQVGFFDRLTRETLGIRLTDA